MTFCRTFRSTKRTWQAPFAVIKYFELLNARVLVLCPKKLRDNWTVYRENDERNPLKEDRLAYTVLSHTDLSREGGKPWTTVTQSR